jgi:hypothetical protein
MFNTIYKYSAKCLKHEFKGFSVYLTSACEDINPLTLELDI